MDTPPIRKGIEVNQELADRLHAVGFDINSRNEQTRSKLVSLHREVFTYTLESAGCWNCIIQLYLELNSITKPFKKNLTIMSKKSIYSFKQPNGSLMDYHSGYVLSNDNISDEQAEKLLERTPEYAQALLRDGKAFKWEDVKKEKEAEKKAAKAPAKQEAPKAEVKKEEVKK